MASKKTTSSIKKIQSFQQQMKSKIYNKTEIKEFILDNFLISMKK